MIVTFRLSTLGTGGAERVFISVASALVAMQDVAIHFVVDRLGQGSLERVVADLGFSIFGLDCGRTAGAILPLKRYFDTQRPDIVISAYTDTNMAMLLSAQLARHKCPLIVTEHASLDEHWQASSWKRRKLLNAYVSLGYRMADHVLTVSEGIAAQVRHRLNTPAKVSCIYNPIRFSGVPATHVAVAPEQRPAEKVILAVGRIARQKDYMTLLRGFKEVAAVRNVRLVIVGEFFEPAEKRLLDDYLVSAGLTGKVEFAGFSGHVENYYRAADLFVLSSAWEGFGNVLVEALAFGLPIVSTNCNHGPAEILCDGKYGALVPVADFTAMAHAICRALDAPAHDRHASRERAQAFSERRIGAQYWDLIQRLKGAQ